MLSAILSKLKCCCDSAVDKSQSGPGNIPSELSRQFEVFPSAQTHRTVLQVFIISSLNENTFIYIQHIQWGLNCNLQFLISFAISRNFQRILVVIALRPQLPPVPILILTHSAAIYHPHDQLCSTSVEYVGVGWLPDFTQYGPTLFKDRTQRDMTKLRLAVEYRVLFPLMQPFFLKFSNLISFLNMAGDQLK